MTSALLTLAVNLLTQVMRRRDRAVAVGCTSSTVLRLGPRFCRECLLTAHADGWVIPRASVLSWISAQSHVDTSAGRRRRSRPSP